MKRIGILVCLCLMITGVNAQKKEDSKKRTKRTLLRNSSLSGGFAGVTLKSGEFGSQNGLWLGGETGAIFGGDLGIGLAGYGLINTVKSSNQTSEGNSLYFQSGYGGIFLEPAMLEDRSINLSFPTLVGVGGIVEGTIGGVIDELDDFDFDEHDIYDGDAFWVLEPGVQLSLNVTRWMKFNAGVSYRMAYGLDMPKTSSSELNGLQGTFSFKLGWF